MYVPTNAFTCIHVSLQTQLHLPMSSRNKLRDECLNQKEHFYKVKSAEPMLLQSVRQKATE